MTSATHKAVTEAVAWFSRTPVIGERWDYETALRHGQALASAVEEPGSASISNVWSQARANHQAYSATESDESDIRFLTLGLTGEAGEVMEAVLAAALVVQASGKVANLVKERWRDGDGHDDAIRREIADVCAYAFMLADKMGFTPSRLIETIAEKQATFIAKMEARQG